MLLYLDTALACQEIGGIKSSISKSINTEKKFDWIIYKIKKIKMVFFLIKQVTLLLAVIANVSANICFCSHGPALTGSD